MILPTLLWRCTLHPLCAPGMSGDPLENSDICKQVKSRLQSIKERNKFQVLELRKVSRRKIRRLKNPINTVTPHTRSDYVLYRPRVSLSFLLHHLHRLLYLLLFHLKLHLTIDLSSTHPITHLSSLPTIHSTTILLLLLLYKIIYRLQ